MSYSCSRLMRFFPLLPSLSSKSDNELVIDKPAFHKAAKTNKNKSTKHRTTKREPSYFYLNLQIRKHLSQLSSLSLSATFTAVHRHFHCVHLIAVAVAVYGSGSVWQWQWQWQCIAVAVAPSVPVAVGPVFVFLANKAPHCSMPHSRRIVTCRPIYSEERWKEIIQRRGKIICSL